MGTIITFKNVDFSQIVEEQVIITARVATNENMAKVVTLVASEDNYTIYYTTDGSTPTSASNVYNASTGIVLNEDTTIKAIGYDLNGENPSIILTKEVVVGSTVIYNDTITITAQDENVIDNLISSVLIKTTQKIYYKATWTGDVSTGSSPLMLNFMKLDGTAGGTYQSLLGSIGSQEAYFSPTSEGTFNRVRLSHTGKSNVVQLKAILMPLT